jgi:Tfp pilus assembly protein PilN
MMFSRTGLSVVMLGDKLVIGVLQHGKLQTFVVEAEDPPAALRAELESRSLRARTIAIGLPRAAVTVKPIELPEVAGEVREMVRFELERHVPFPAEDAPFDFVPFEPMSGAPSGRQVLILAAERRTVEGALRLVTEAHLRAGSITVAAHDLVGLASLPRKQRTVWVHRVDEEADVLFLSGRTIQLSRHLVSGHDDAVTTEIQQSLALLRWRGPDAVWLSGDVTVPTGPTTSPLAGLGAPITPPRYKDRVARKLGAILEEPRGARLLAAATLLAGRERPLDLLPIPLRPRRITRAQILTAVNAAAGLVLIIAALLAPGQRDRQRLAALNTEISKLDPSVRTVETMLQELERKRKLLTTIQSIEAGGVKPMPVLRELTDLLPTDSWLTLLSMDAKGVELTGQAAAASALIPLLENSPRLERVEFASPVTRGRDKEQFRIVAKWEVPASAPAPPASPVSQGAPAALPAPGTPAGRAVPPAPGASAVRPPPVPTPAPGTAPRPPGAPGTAVPGQAAPGVRR